MKLKTRIRLGALYGIWAALALFVLFALASVALYVSRLVVTGKTVSVCRYVSVEQTFNLNGGHITLYQYLVHTDDGTFEMTNVGTLASPNFGEVEAGKEYVFHTRGVAVSCLGIYPYISIIE